MSTKYKATEIGKAYFITITTVGWVDIFTRKNQRNLIMDSLNFCIKKRGMVLYAFCLMPSHLHMICRADDETRLSDLIRDFKKYTSKKIIRNIIEEPESRREWLLELFSRACEHLKKDQRYKVWQDGYHAKVLYSSKFLYQKLDYIHNNPVVDQIVQNPEDYLYSSARNYAGLDSKVKDVVKLHI